MAMISSRRFFAVMAISTSAVLFAGCASFQAPRPGTSSHPNRSEYDVSHHGPRPTAMAIKDGVEVWDLTVPPTAEAFGIDPDDTVMVGAYSSSTPGGRPVRFLLPGGEDVDVRANEVVFELSENDQAITSRATGKELSPAGRFFDLRVDAPAAQGAEAGVAAYRKALQELGLPDDTVSELQEQIERAATVDPLSSPRVGVSASIPKTDGFRFSVSTAFRPDRDDPTFLLEFHGAWDPLPVS
ncbi:hypothetical protein [Curtobacterium sp. MCBD17_023]|uniref:hypothetical protein n=2 Tax=Curtobacterium TaxID=2034 RepID=UPI0011B7695A|nr:hypothetical protein [Curtobacterium sp. MCBD17_023]